MKIFEITKIKVKGLGILLIGIIITIFIKYILMIYFAREMGPENFGNFVNFCNTNVFFNIFLVVIYILWLYLIVSIILNLNKKKR